MFLHHYEICVIMGSTRLHQLRNHKATSVHPLGVWKKQFNFLRKLCEAGGWVTGSGDKDLGVGFSCACVLIVNVSARDSGVIVLEFDFVAKFGFLATELSRNRPALCRYEREEIV